MKRSPLKRKSCNLKRSPLKRKPIRKYGGGLTHRKYSRKIDYVKALKNKAENLWKEAGLLLHGNECEVKKNYPEINIIHTPEIQGDHCISRSNKYFFLDINNHSSVCSSCNQAKSFDNKSVSRAIDEIVRKRNPQWFKDAIWLDRTCEANVNFSKVWWLEEKIEDLKFIIEELTRVSALPISSPNQ